MTSTPAVDVVIVSYNTASDLDRCLASLTAHPPTPLGTITVVDNASTDGSVDVVRTRYPQVHVIALDSNTGFAAANNIGMRESRSPLVLLLNSDTIVPEGALDRLVARLLETGATAAGPRLVDADGRPEVSFGAMLTPQAEWRQRRLVRQARRADTESVESIARHLADERDVDWVTGACLLVRRAAAATAGYFDERYFMYEEDVDLCAALRARGGRVLYTPRAEVIHLRGRSSAGSSTSRQYDRSHLAFYRKHLPFWAPWLRLWLWVRGRV